MSSIKQIEGDESYYEIIGMLEDEARPPIRRSRRRPDLDGDSHTDDDDL